MTIKYGAEDVLQIGIEIEKNGVNFYKAAAEAEVDPEIKNLFTELSNWETGHVRLFENLKKKLSGNNDKAAQNKEGKENLEHIKSIADNHIFVMDDNVIEMVAKCNDSTEVLRMALQFEKDSVVLYSAMKQVADEELSVESIESVIQEEIKHVVMISDKISSLTL